MLKFFRKIRQNLLSENSFSKYLLYALGEIILVVIGILIALQINNWNENRKLSQSEIVYLKGIKNDLTQDTLVLSSVILFHKKRLARIIAQDTSIELSFSEIIGELPRVTPTEKIEYFFQTDRPYRPKMSSYNSLISEGRASIISNKELYNEIQKIYEDDVQALNRISEGIWDKNNELGTKHAYEIKYEDFGSPVQIANKVILADLYNYFRIINFYTLQVVLMKKQIEAVIHLLEEECQRLE